MKRILLISLATMLGLASCSHPKKIQAKGCHGAFFDPMLLAQGEAYEDAQEAATNADKF